MTLPPELLAKMVEAGAKALWGEEAYRVSNSVSKRFLCEKADNTLQAALATAQEAGWTLQRKPE